MLQSGLYPEGADHVNDENPPGCFTFGNDEVRCNAGRNVLGSRSLRSALTVSSDVYFYSVGNEFWNRYRDEGQAAGFAGDLAGDKLPDAQHPVGNAIQHTAATYGFGESTGIGLGDQAGVIPNHEYRVKVNPTTPDNQFWRRGDSASLAVGPGRRAGDAAPARRRLRRVRQRRHALPAPRWLMRSPRAAADCPPASSDRSSTPSTRSCGAPPRSTPEVRQPIVDGPARGHLRPGRHRGRRVQRLPGRCR